MTIYMKLCVLAWPAPWNLLGRLKQGVIEVPLCRELPLPERPDMQLLPRSKKGERGRGVDGRVKR